jgi:HSP20 family protein
MTYPARRPTWYTPYRPIWDPFADLAALRAQMNRMLGAVTGAREETGWAGDLDLDETEHGWTVTARLPGVAPDQVSVEVDDRDLYIRAKTEEQAQAAGGAAARRAAFDYRLTLPADVDPERADATMENGLLTVHLPRAARARRREITVGRGPAQSQLPGGTEVEVSQTGERPGQPGGPGGQGS